MPHPITRKLTITAQRFTSRTHGNTYHSARAYVDGKLVAYVPYPEYGYGDHYRTTIAEQLAKRGYLPGREPYPNGGSEGLSQYCGRHGIKFKAFVTDVLEREAKAFSKQSETLLSE